MARDIIVIQDIPNMSQPKVFTFNEHLVYENLRFS